MVVARAERSTTELGPTGPYRVIGSPHDGGPWHIDLWQDWSKVVELICLPSKDRPLIRCFLSTSASPQRVLELTERLVQEAVEQELPVTWGGSLIKGVVGNPDAEQVPLKRPLETNELDGMDKLLWINTPYGVVRRISHDIYFKNRGVGTAKITADFPLSTVSLMERFVKDLTGESPEGLAGIEELFFQFRVGYALTHGHILAEKMAKEMLGKDYSQLDEDEYSDTTDKLEQLLLVAECLKRGLDPKLYGNGRIESGGSLADMKREAGEGDIVLPSYEINDQGRIVEVLDWICTWSPKQPKS